MGAPYFCKHNITFIKAPIDDYPDKEVVLSPFVEAPLFQKRSSAPMNLCFLDPWLQTPDLKKAQRFLSGALLELFIT